jgi:aspartate/methionine/tyrosine aminotransferase
MSQGFFYVNVEIMIKEANRLSNISEYYFSTKLQEIRDLQAQGKDIINLGIGNPDMKPSPRTIAALSASSEQEGNHGYQNYRGVLELRTAIANWQERMFRVKANPITEVLPLMGSKEGIMHITNAFVNPGEEVLMPNPGYPTYASVTNLIGGNVRYYNLTSENAWQIDIAELENQDLTKVKLMWVNYPHMPTGARGTTKMFSALIRLAHAHGFLLCNDNPYSLTLNDSPKSILEIDGAKEVALELNSLSKSHNMAGWRIGWVTAHEQYINAILKVKSNVDSGMFLPVQHAAIAALDNLPDWHARQNLVYEKRRILAWKFMKEIGAKYVDDQVGMFVWAKVSDDIVDVEKFVDELIYKAGVFIAPGKIFGSNGNRYVRVSLCSSEEILSEAVVRVKNYLKTNKVW